LRPRRAIPTSHQVDGEVLNEILRKNRRAMILKLIRWALTSAHRNWRANSGHRQL